MAVLEGFDDGDDRACLGLRSFEAPDLEGEPGPVDEQSDDDLRVDATFFRIPDLPQVILFLSLEI